jgi:predicted TIM-barrel fold metal-dependent hydrolase
MIIDCHCHVGIGDGLNGPWDTRAPLKNYIAWADEFGIVQTNLFSVFHSNYAKANYEVSKIVRQNPDRFYGFAFIHAVRDAGKVYEMVKTAVLNYGFCGVKVHRYDARISREICEAAKIFKIPVLYDPVGELAPVELIAKEYPEVTFIIPHLSSFADDWKSQNSFISILERYHNIYTDTSAVRRFDVLQEALQRAGPDKILFGSDGPWIHPGVELTKIYALHLNKESEEKILYKNFLKLTVNTFRNKREQAYPNFAND